MTYVEQNESPHYAQLSLSLATPRGFLPDPSDAAAYASSTVSTYTLTNVFVCAFPLQLT